MNATELADYLDNNVEAMIMSEQTHIYQAATMLRQQQAEIEALKAQVLEWENAEVPTEVMADIIVELEKRGFIEKAQEK
jgi:formylmethanofuran dehydrogenase subunit A